jgi:galactokinase
VTVRYAAPGRINLIGEHTDYNLGWALPVALPQRTVVTFEPSDADAITVCSDRVDGSVRIPLRTKPGGVTGWAGYVAGVVWALRFAGHPVPGGTMSITSDVEMGSGLSSSAALECAALGAFVAAAGWRIDRIDQARIAQRAENEYVGAPTGLLDQLASLFGEESTALLIDFRKLTVQPVVFDPSASGVALLLIDSREKHGHVGGEYAARRVSCERAAADVGVVSLREIQDRGLSVLDGVTDAIDARRARHVLTENQRVFDFVAAVSDSNYVEAGRIFNASHASMRDDFEITTENIDLIADTAVGAGALGARMTGGGFGGCVIALAPLDRAEAVGAAVREAVRPAGYGDPVVARTHAAQGAGALR